MLKNYFKIAWRNLIKDRQFTLLNLVGLSTGLACSLLLYLWISDELSVDKYNEKDRQLYQVMTNAKTSNGIRTGTYTSGLLGNTVSKEIPEIEYSVSILPASWFPHKGVMTIGDTHLKAAGQYVGKDYFNVFTCKYIQGDKDQLFADNNTIAISDELATKLFRTTQGLIGKTLKWDMDSFGGDFRITGVFKKVPSNATQPFDCLLNYGLVLERRPELLNWGNGDPNTFVVVKQGATIDRVNTKLGNFIRSKRKDDGSSFFLARYSDRWLYGKYENGVQAGGRITYVKLFSIIAIVILLIACINFMNLSTAKAARRIKEVGIKKVVGASRRDLIFQYLGESMMMTLLSLALAILLILALLPVFNGITGKQLLLNIDGRLIGSVLGIVLFTGLVAGSYPAFYLSHFRPAAVLKGNLSSSVGELWIRKGLVVFQFTLSVIFIIGVLIIYRQINYIQSKDLGYSRDNTIHFEIPFGSNQKDFSVDASFLDRVRTIPGVVSASSYYHNLTGDHGGIGGFQWPGKDPNKDIDFANLEVGYGFLQTAGIQIIEGRNFSNNANASKEIVFNEAAIAAMGLKDPIGKTVKFWDQQRMIVGVAKNFHFESLYETVKPCFFQEYPVMPNFLVRIKAGTEQQTIAKLQQAFLQFSNGQPFDYKFLDEDYRALYASENRIALLSRYFAGLAIIVSCLGLFGLAAFAAQKRRKEIGIRKVVGASVRNVIMLLSADFLKLVLLAIVVAFPVAWWVMSKWLSGFAYSVPLGASAFLIAGGSILLITLLTISFQSIKAALANPADSLKSE
ncbi:MAG TPA: FtsX-like permease family protein [Puia sp.]|nr:FtsX-like permease family protein [Puia sp.]